ncbi:MAG: hypothetical protein J0M26_28590 [Planctomycetes bacterium]|nr:hypothetical protein [Planctomycetota bacterium]
MNYSPMAPEKWIQSEERNAFYFGPHGNTPLNGINRTTVRNRAVVTNMNISVVE